MKAVVAAFNQEKALVGAFSVIVQPVVEPMDHFTALVLWDRVAVVARLGLHERGLAVPEVGEPLEVRGSGDDLGEDEGDGEDDEEHAEAAQGEGDQQPQRLQRAQRGLQHTQI